MMLQRNIQTASNRMRPTLKSNLAQSHHGSSRQKFVKRPNKFINNTISHTHENLNNSSSRVTGKGSKPSSPSPLHHQNLSEVNAGAIRHEGETSPFEHEALSGNEQDGIYMTTEQNEGLDYTANGHGILTPDLLQSTTCRQHAEVFYNSPN